jgi:hypothetical protein
MVIGRCFLYLEDTVINRKYILNQDMLSGNLDLYSGRCHSANFHFSVVHFDLDIRRRKKGGEKHA